ncbi:uncharacterized protein RHO17_024694 [Thomomys bottae]
MEQEVEAGGADVNLNDLLPSSNLILPVGSSVTEKPCAVLGGSIRGAHGRDGDQEGDGGGWNTVAAVHPDHCARQSERAPCAGATPRGLCTRAPAWGYKNLATCCHQPSCASSDRPEKPVHHLQRLLASSWTLRPAPVLLEVPAPARAPPASVVDAIAPNARRAAAPAALRNVRSAAMIVYAKEQRRARRRRRSAAAASEVPPFLLSTVCSV